jgi:hypothetical protein
MYKKNERKKEKKTRTEGYKPSNENKRDTEEINEK